MLLSFAATRNEGPFLLEWIAWQRMLGFHPLVAINDCTDRSPALLALLQDAGLATVVEHAPPAGMHPKASAYRAGRRHPLARAAAWMMVSDVDELLVLHEDAAAQPFLDRFPEADAVAIHWRCFGSGGLMRYEDSLLHRTFLFCGPAGAGTNAFFKTILRDPLRWGALSDHAPVRHETRAPRVVDGLGRPLPRFLETSGPVRFTEPDGVTHARAQVSHYIVRWRESFDLKRGTPSASAGVDRYTDAFLRRHDRSGCRDASALAFAPAFAPHHAQLRAVPGALRLHHLCCADYVARICAAAGVPPEEDDRWRLHMERAG